MNKDEAILDLTEALHIQKTRDLFFEELRKLLSMELGAGLNVRKGFQLSNFVDNEGIPGLGLSY